MPRGGPRVIAPKVSHDKVIDKIMEHKGKVYLAAHDLGLNPATIRNYAKANPLVKQAIKDAKGRMLDVAEKMLYQAIERGEAWSICFYLKTIGKKRGFTEVNRVHLGQDKNAPPIQTVNANLSFDLTQLGLPKETLELIYARMQAVKDANPDMIPDTKKEDSDDEHIPELDSDD